MFASAFRASRFSSHLASHSALVPTLLKTGRRFVSFNGRLIFNALERGDFQLLKERLEQCPDLTKVKDEASTSPLHYLAGASPYAGLRLPLPAQPPKKFVQLLLSSGAKATDLNYYGETPLHIAASTAYFIMVKQLLKEKYINPLVRSNSGQTALHKAILATACFDPYFRTESLLLKHAPQLVHVQDQNQHTPLFALIHSLPGIVSSSQNSLNSLFSDLKRIEQFYISHIPEKIDFLLKHGASVEAMGDKMHPTKSFALEVCLRKLDPAPSNPLRYEDSAFRPALAAICQKTQSLPCRDNYGWSLLHWACYTQSEEVAKELIARGLNPDEKDNQGLTPRHLARMQVNLPILDLMNESLDEAVVTPHYIAEQVLRLPARDRKPHYWYTDDLARREQYFSKIFTTGLFNVGYKGRLETTISELYEVKEEFTLRHPMGELYTVMGKALQERNLEKVKHLVDRGWNVEIDNDFLFYELLDQRYRYGGAPECPIQTSSAALKEACKQDKGFFRDALPYLSSKKWTGITMTDYMDSYIEAISDL